MQPLQIAVFREQLKTLNKFIAIILQWTWNTQNQKEKKFLQDQNLLNAIHRRCKSLLTENRTEFVIDKSRQLNTGAASGGAIFPLLNNQVGENAQRKPKIFAENNSQGELKKSKAAEYQKHDLGFLAK